MHGHRTTITRAAGASACALLAVALMPATAGATPDDDTAQVLLAGRAVDVIVETAAHDHTDAGHDGHAEPPIDAPMGLQLPDGTLVGVEGLAESGAASGEQVRLVVDVPAEVEEDVADAAGERALDAARDRPAAAGSAVSAAVVTAATTEGVTLATEPGAVRTTAEAPPAATAAAVGPPRPITVVVADMGDGDEHVPSDAELTAMVEDTSDYWADQSAGRVTFSLAATPTRYTTALTCEDPWALWDEAGKAAGFPGGRRAHLVVVLLDEEDPAKKCGYGVGSVGWGVDAGGVSSIANADDLSLVAHEVGHNLSFEHANALECTTAPRQDFADAAPQDPCDVREYGDLLDVMAAALPQPGAVSAMARARVGFLDADERRSVSLLGTSVVDLAPLAGDPGTGVKDVGVTDPRTGVVYRLENRSATGRDQGRLGLFGARPGLRVLRADGGGNATLALDATPTARATDKIDLDRALPDGDVWRSASGGVEVRTTTLADGAVRAQVSLAGTGEVHGPRATTPVVSVPELVRGRSARLEGSVSAGQGSVTPAGSISLDLAGGRATATVRADGTFTADLTPVLSGSQTLTTSFTTADADRWGDSTDSRAVDVAGSGAVSVVRVTRSGDGAAPSAGSPSDLVLDLGADAVDGTVTVWSDSRVLTTAPVTGRVTTVRLPALPAGSSVLDIAYDGGTSAELGSTGLRLEVARGASTTRATVTTTATASRAAVLRATVSGPATPTGAVTVRRGEQVLATGTLADGGLALTLPVLPVGRQDLVVAYAGDANSLPGQVALPVVVAKDTATLEVVAPTGPTTAGGQAVVVRVRAGGTAATGVVRLNVDGRTATKAALVRGEVRLPLPKLAAGRRTVTVSYDGSATASPVAQPLTVDVARSTGTTTARPAATTVTAGRTSTVAVTVTSPAGTPTGEVVLKNAAGRVVARATLSGGRATLTQPALRRGTHRFAVEHVGDAATAPSRSAAWTVTAR